MHPSRPEDRGLEWRADRSTAWIAAHAKRLYRFDSDILTQGWCDDLEGGEILGASAHVPHPVAGGASISKQVVGHGSEISARHLRDGSHATTIHHTSSRLTAHRFRAGSANAASCMQSGGVKIFGAVRAPMHAFVSGTHASRYTPIGG